LVRPCANQRHECMLVNSGSKYTKVLLTCNLLPCFYARKQLLLSARLSHRNSVCLSVCTSHGWISQKTVQARITKFLPSAARKTLVSGTVKLFHKFEPRTSALNERGVGKICDFWPISRCILVTVRDRA